MVLPNSHRISRVPRYLGVLSRKSDTFHLQGYHLLRRVFPDSSTKYQICNFPTKPELRPIGSHDSRYTTLPGLHITGLGYFPFARRYLGNHYCFLFLRLLRCFSSPRSPRRPMYSVYDVTVLTVTGFPIQKSPDQSLFSSSPRLIAAFHVFHRLLTPRHPPFALSSLATKLYCHNKNNAWNALMLFASLIVKEQNPYVLRIKGLRSIPKP